MSEKKIKFNTQFNGRNPAVHAQMSPENKVEQLGQMRNSVKVKQLITAGRLLEASRDDQFDFNLNIDMTEQLEDITRIKGVDLVDVMEAKQKLIEKIKNKRSEYLKKIKEEQHNHQKELLKKEIIKELENQSNVAPPPDDE